MLIHLHLFRVTPVYDELSDIRLEAILTKTVHNTKALQCLSIIMKEGVVFSFATVTGWLIVTEKILRHLHYNVKTPGLHILELCYRHRLTELDLAYNSITKFDPSYQKFPFLMSLKLTCVKISTLDLSCWLSACHKLEVLNLFALDFDTDSPDMSMTLSKSLKDVQVEILELRKFILEADSLEKLELTNCTMNTFKFRGKGTLIILDLDKVVVSHLYIGKNAENLEIVNVRNCPIMSLSKFYHMIVKLSKAKRIKLHGVMSGDDNNEVVVRDTMSARFPQLTHLSLSYEFGGAFQHGLLGYYPLENVVEVELRWRSISHLQSQWLVGLLHRCPKLRKLIIGGAVVRVMRREDCPILSAFTTFIINLMKDHRDIEVQFLYN